MAMSDQQPEPPRPIRGDTIGQQFLREFVWRPARLKNDWRFFVITGREGTGKSLTCASILNAVDTSFGPEQVHFKGAPFLEDINADVDRPGRALMLDEAGVSFGNRTWHDREQVEANQALQTARDDNRIVGLTLPRLKELDVQLHGRLHLLLETVKMKKGEWVELSPYVMDVSRKGAAKEYTKRPKMVVNGRQQKVERFRIGPPSADFVAEYEQKKSEWKGELFEDTTARYRGDDPDEDDGELEDPQEIVNDIVEDGSLDEYIGDNYGQEYVDGDLIAIDYGIGDRKSKKVKKALQREAGI